MGQGIEQIWKRGNQGICKSLEACNRDGSGGHAWQGTDPGARTRPAPRAARSGSRRTSCDGVPDMREEHWRGMPEGGASGPDAYGGRMNACDRAWQPIAALSQITAVLGGAPAPA